MGRSNQIKKLLLNLFELINSDQCNFQRVLEIISDLTSNFEPRLLRNLFSSEEIILAEIRFYYRLGSVIALKGIQREIVKFKTNLCLEARNYSQKALCDTCSFIKNENSFVLASFKIMRIFDLLVKCRINLRLRRTECRR